MSYKPTIVSLFSGCGGFDLGFQMAGYKTIWAIDNYGPAVETFNLNFPGEICVRRDIRKIELSEIPDSDLIIGGFPCQSFSSAGRRRGFNDPRGDLFKEYARILKGKRPKAFVAENVSNLLRIHKGEALKIIVKEFEDCGYVVKTCLYDFQEFGVPQRRKRIIFVGIRNDLNYTYAFPKPPGRTVTAGEALADIPPDCPNNEKRTSPCKLNYIKLLKPGQRINQVEGMRDKFLAWCFKLEPGKVSPTIMADESGAYWAEDRMLTNRERARLQSFPDSFVFCGSYHGVSRQIGNAVPPLGVVEVARSLLPLFRKSRKG